MYHKQTTISKNGTLKSAQVTYRKIRKEKQMNGKQKKQRENTNQDGSFKPNIPVITFINNLTVPSRGQKLAKCMKNYDPL